MEAARRFISDFIVVIDGTFNTNAARLPLLIAVGQLNSGKTFPVAFYQCKSESKESYTFFQECLKAHYFSPLGESPVAPPRVILSDQNGGLTASIFDAFPEAKQQFYTWHAIETIVTKLRAIEHPKELFQERIDSQGNKIPGLRSRYWNYILAESLEALNENREALYQAKGDVFRAYIDKEWRPKETKTVLLYTRKYTNLGATASQRSESYYNIIREITNS